MSEGHAKADKSQVLGQRPVAPRGKGSQDRTVCPSGKGKATIKDIESSEGEEINGKGIHPKGTINTMASFHSQSCDSEEDFEVDSRQVHSDQNDVETSFMAFATVKKKKGDRQRLWEYITMQSSCTPLGWTLMGDFNATLKAFDSSGGDPYWAGHKLDFGRCLEQAELTSLPYRGLRYTWHNGQGSTNMIIKKLD
ncbi:hypothetical protein OIU77_004295 [Salix suchowensis]|uniref:Uncharacterized protein n=1 Tax=Salix suchowensis TaxID=1278906 RepID=A0ABQ9AVJ3_9ROSI|nr:hypothetical protein OIU77_004295 [Salix suchowensis]